MTISDFAWFICSQPGAPDPYGLADLELVFLPDDFCPAMPAGGRGLLESVFGGESGYHVRISGYEDPQADPGLTPGTSDRVSMRGDRFHSAGSFSQLFE